jgi:SAM-dependent methyltransferase
MSEARYDRAFYERHRRGSGSSAEVVAPLVVEWVRPKSVVDVGCGMGTWAAAFSRRGVGDVVGVDGSPVPADLLQIPAERFQVRDLSKPLDLGRTFDLAVCLEVAEHLPARFADGLVASLTSLAPVVLFSAAIPGQGGVGHVNEEWPRAWAERFSAAGFAWADPIRPRIWNDPGVEPWYAQNVLLFHRPGRFQAPAPWDAAGAAPDARPAWPLPLVHPHGWLRAKRPPTVGRALSDLRRALGAAVSRPFRRSPPA